MNYTGKIGKYLIWLCLVTGCISGPPFDVTLESLLREITVAEESVRFPKPAYTCFRITQGDPEKMDREDILPFHTSTNIRKRVIFDQAGPGAITRIGVSTSLENVALYIYADQQTEPALSVFFGTEAASHEGLISSSVPLLSYLSTEGRSGIELLLPIPYARECRIILETSSPEMDACLFEIDHRRYPNHVRIETFSPGVWRRFSGQLMQTERLSARVWSPASAQPYVKEKYLQAGDSLTLCLPGGEQALSQMIVYTDAPDGPTTLQLMRQLWLTAMFDGGRCIQVPLYDFAIGNGWQPASLTDPLSGGQEICLDRWLMPWRKEGEIALTNFSSFPVHVSLAAYVQPFPRQESALYFHTDWQPLPETPGGSDPSLLHNVIHLTGKGLYKGKVWVGNQSPRSYIRLQTIPFTEELMVLPDPTCGYDSVAGGNFTVFWYGDGYSEAIQPELSREELASILQRKRE